MALDSKNKLDTINPFCEENIETGISLYSFIRGTFNGCFTPEERIEYQAKNLLKKLNGDHYELSKRRIKEKIIDYGIPSKKPKVLKKTLIYTTLFYKERQ